MITAFYAALCSILILALVFFVIRARWKYNVAIENGGNFELTRRIRAHQNCIEYTPVFLILLFLYEYSGGATHLIHGLGLAFIAGRITHAFSLIKAERYENERLRALPGFRMAGMILTLVSLAVLITMLLLKTMPSIF